MPLLATDTNDLEVISLWLTDKSKTTRITYTSTVNQFLEFVNRPLPQLTLADINLWVQRLNLTYKDYTVNNKIITLKSLLTFCYKVGYLDSDLGIILKAKCLDTSVNSKCLSASEVRQLIKGTTNIRDGVLLIIIFSLGLRVSEAVQLKWTDFKNNKVTIRGKGNKTRVLTVPPDVPLLLESLPHDYEYVFTNIYHNPLSRSAVFSIVKVAAKNAGLDEHISPHWLRHSHATLALKNGCDIYLLKESLGHRKITTTEKYLKNNPNTSSSDFIDF